MLRVPRFIAEMGEPRHRARLHLSVKTGYSTLFALLALTIAADRLGVVRFRGAFVVPFAVKFVTNTAAWLALRVNRGQLLTATVNVATDGFAITAALYFTGGLVSPLFPLYLIELTVVALLGNAGLTLLCASVSTAMYVAMALLTFTGALHPWPAPIAVAGGLTPGFLAVQLAITAFVLGVPAYYTARILQDLRRQQVALEQRTAQLVEAGQQRSQFMANVTHELRTPIHGICGLSDLIESGIYGPVTTKQRDAQGSIRRSAQGLLALIDDLLELARGDAGKLTPEPRSLEIGELIEAVVAATRWMVGTRTLVVATRVEPELPSIETDPRMLKQIVINLLSNAAKFTPDGGTITVTARRDGSTAVRLEVSDSGIGIASGEQERIFEAFRQVDGSSERAYGGVGLGLAVVRRLARALGAKIDLESAPGEGATFGVTVPVAWQTAEAPK